MEIYDDRMCQLGESPIWHSGRQQLFWTDILTNRLCWRSENSDGEWKFPGPVSAIAIVDRRRLVAADDKEIFLFDLESAERSTLCPLEADIERHRSNDGRADPWGGFWISTMEREGEPGAGSLYRWYRGELRKLVDGLAIPNAICFDEKRGLGYYSDTLTHCLFRMILDADGWPLEDPDLFLDLRAEMALIDGAVTDADGNIHFALWNSGEILTVNPLGVEIARLSLGVKQTTCPAFGGADYQSLFVTSAAVGLPEAPHQGTVFQLRSPFRGLPEPRVIVD
ncbi:SMP-30/gluconolactonase/LRE family protein [Sphingopyxis sp. DHUNG17]|uniref:SMP-30/gluconolactonase/LRE family protein n=1 Tax=Sphingopyxis jiangsuensis TaxID=2871171 RepID=UPI00191F8765|nr:SMP-30/gluconolactonase/LRE family protein [Sphingopyxis lutea]MBL0768501.1 SMP-30/gluconolactonase/LRE family protein [Sphingopyxis lutea]